MHVDGVLHESANQPIHDGPVVGTTVQGVEEQEKIDPLPLEFRVSVMEQTFDYLRLLLDVGGVLSP